MLMWHAGVNMSLDSLRLKRLYESAYFIDEQTYEGKDLGVTYGRDKTTFKVWAPIAKEVSLNLYSKGTSAEDGDKLLGQYQMEKMDRNVYAVEVSDRGDLHGVYYTYLILNEDSGDVPIETADPYCVAAGANSERSMIVDLFRTNPVGWDRDKRVGIPASQAVLYEVHVKDFSYDKNSGVKEEYRGRYLAFTEEKTTYKAGIFKRYPTCLNYLKRLGITHVHLLPVADSGSVDEVLATDGVNDTFNWGYDPMLYNVPEGQYATDARDGQVRINEMKQMIMSLHKAGIGVVMDVVYNHTYHRDNPLHITAPYYYHRVDGSGEFANGSGCGNETASEHIMCRRFIVESILYWAREYHIDGFRFDLMGLHDTGTMNIIRDELDKLPGGENILLYGEPWTAGSTALAPGYYPAITDNAVHMKKGIHLFSDSIRDAIKGSVFDASEPGYVNADGYACEFVDKIKSSIMVPSRVSYVSAHDNYTLYDKLLLSCNETKDATRAYIQKYGEGSRHDESVFDRNERVAAMNKMAAGVYFTAAGMPFLQAGEEFLRTKYGHDNTYNVSADLNKMDWKRAYKNRDIVEYYKGLIAMRKAHPEFYNMPDADVVVKFIDNGCDETRGNIQFIVDKKTKVVYNPTAKTVEVTSHEADLDIHEKL